MSEQIKSEETTETTVQLSDESMENVSGGVHPIDIGCILIPIEPIICD